MNSLNEIGGYLELELKRGEMLHSDGLLLNSARSCFEYILRVKQPAKVYLPYFTCDVMLEPLRRLKITYNFYSINDNLEIKDDIVLKNDELLVYTNYFGVKDNYCDMLGDKYQKQLILDCTQAYYFKPNSETAPCFYSPRKFFGVPDGGILLLDDRGEEVKEKDTSYQRFEHLIKRIDLGASAGYQDFKDNDASLSGQPIKLMSDLTRKLLESIDYEDIKNKRIDNFTFIHEALGKVNKLPLFPENSRCPMVYPFYTEDVNLREELIKNNIYVATYWPNVFEWCKKDTTEYRLAKFLLPLPIDQRYGRKEMGIILGVING